MAEDLRGRPRRGRDPAEVIATWKRQFTRAGDPLYELALPLGAHRKEDRFWQHTLRSLAAHFGVADAQVRTSVACIDRRRQWAKAHSRWDRRFPVW